MIEKTYLREKKKLKGKNIRIKESLTATRMKKLKKVIEIYDFGTSDGTSDGKILFKDGSENTSLFYD